MYASQPDIKMVRTIHIFSSRGSGIPIDEKYSMPAPKLYIDEDISLARTFDLSPIRKYHFSAR